jgi:hypothetical protein
VSVCVGVWVCLCVAFTDTCVQTANISQLTGPGPMTDMRELESAFSIELEDMGEGERDTD